LGHFARLCREKDVTVALWLTYLAGTIATLLAGSLALFLAAKGRLRPPSVLLCHAVVGSSVYLLLFQLLKYRAHKNYVDFAAWSEIVGNIARGHGAISSIQEGLVSGSANWFSVHFTPLIYVFGLAFAAIPTPVIVIVLQFAFLSATVPILYRYAKDSLGSPHQALVIASVFVLYPTYQYIHLYEFEMLRFSIPILLCAFAALERGTTGRYWLWIFLALLVREDVAVTTFCLGLYAMAFLPDRRRLGGATACLSVVYFFVVVQVVMPMLRAGPATTHVAAYWFASFGTTPSEILVGILTRPWVVLAAISNPVKLANIFMYGLPVLFLPVLGWRVALIGVGNIGVNLLSDAMTHTSYFLYYLSPSVPFLFIALVKGVAVLGRWLEGSPLGCRVSGSGAVLGGVFAAALSASVLFGPSPISVQFWVGVYRLAPFRTQNFHFSQYVVHERDRLLGEIVAMVPKSASVSAEQHILPELYDRRALRIFPDLSAAEYAVIDKERREKTGVATVPGSWDGLRRDPQSYYDLLERRPDQWALLAQRDGYFVYRRIVR
jgi:uncharacterized membrane protein